MRCNGGSGNGSATENLLRLVTKTLIARWSVPRYSRRLPSSSNKCRHISAQIDVPTQLLYTEIDKRTHPCG